MDIPVLLRRSTDMCWSRGLYLQCFGGGYCDHPVHPRISGCATNTNLGMALGALFGIVLAWASAPMVKR